MRAWQRAPEIRAPSAMRAIVQSIAIVFIAFEAVPISVFACTHAG